MVVNGNVIRNNGNVIRNIQNKLGKRALKSDLKSTVTGYINSITSDCVKINFMLYLLTLIMQQSSTSC